jgi:hypothetical protein
MENSAPLTPNPMATTAAPGVAKKQVSALPVSRFRAEGRARGTVHRIDQEIARLAILAAWPGWAAQHLADRVAKDNDAHAFLRSLRMEQPELFTFRCSLSPHEVAFSWLLKDRCIAY